MGEMTPQGFRHEYARPHSEGELNHLLWEAIDAWEADIKKRDEAVQKAANAATELARQLKEAEARIEAAIEAIERERDPDAPGRPWLVEHVLSILRDETAPTAKENPSVSCG